MITEDQQPISHADFIALLKSQQAGKGTMAVSFSFVRDVPAAEKTAEVAEDGTLVTMPDMMVTFELKNLSEAAIELIWNSFVISTTDMGFEGVQGFMSPAEAKYLEAKKAIPVEEATLAHRMGLN